MKANGNVGAIKERKACDWWHPACYMTYNINNIIIIGNQINVDKKCVGACINVTKRKQNRELHFN